MLINDFCSCHDIQHSDHGYSCRIVFNADHAIFSGHFPGHPVVPGVCTMGIIKELLEQQVGKSLKFQEARNVKFLQLITPGTEPIVSMSWKDIPEGYAVSASLNAAAVPLFKFDAKYVIAGNVT